MKIKTTIKVEITIDESQPKCCDRSCRFLSQPYLNDVCFLFDKALEANEDGSSLRCDDCVKELKKEF
jgi:hypothetical protein